MKAQKILREAADLVGGERQDDYGPPEENFNRIARLWSVVLKQPVSAHQVALCMAQLKVARLVESPEHADSWVDGAAYMGLGAQLAEEPVKPSERPLEWPNSPGGIMPDMPDLGEKLRELRKEKNAANSWHDAKPGEAWVVEFEYNGQRESRLGIVSGVDHMPFEIHAQGESPSVWVNRNDPRITAGRRVWPEEGDDK